MDENYLCTMSALNIISNYYQTGSVCTVDVELYMFMCTMNGVKFVTNRQRGCSCTIDLTIDHTLHLKIIKMQTK